MERTKEALMTNIKKSEPISICALFLDEEKTFHKVTEDIIMYVLRG